MNPEFPIATSFCCDFYETQAKPDSFREGEGRKYAWKYIRN